MKNLCIFSTFKHGLQYSIHRGHESNRRIHRALSAHRFRYLHESFMWIFNITHCNTEWIPVVFYLSTKQENLPWLVDCSWLYSLLEQLLNFIRLTIIQSLKFFFKNIFYTGIILPSGRFPNVCMILTDLAYFTNISNRLLTCGIVIYRYVLVLQSSWVQSPYHRRAFENLIFISILVAAVTLTVWSVVLQDFNLLKHRCFETTEQFYYNFNNFYEEKKIGSPIWDLPLTHPFHALTLICFFASMVVAPIGYLMIFWWVKWFSKRNIINLTNTINITS